MKFVILKALRNLKIMVLLDNIAALRQWRKSVGKLALIPTMGNLHEGHLNLIKAAKNKATDILLSIFVNPIQFGPKEDFNSYPRTLEQDLKKAQTAGANAVFAPSIKEMFPYGKQHIYVYPSQLANYYCGKTRPGHFQGVLTIVARLFNIAAPDWAYFGKKDYQQWIMIQQMTKELNFPVEIIGVETTRDQDGLALSSRNQYLSLEQRQKAVQLRKMLIEVKEKILKENFHHAKSLLAQAKQNMTDRGWDMDYIALARADDLEPANEQDRHLVILAAGRLGNTRLIDNIDFSKLVMEQSLKSVD